MVFAAVGAVWQKPGVREFEGVAHRAATRAGALLRARYGERLATSTKSSAVDLVTEVDHAAERLILGEILQAFPDHGVVAEESPARQGPSAYTWYVDPLDGTTNFAHGYPQFAVSIALARGDDLVLGLVHDPMRAETFTAVRGEGARLNGAPIAVSDTGELGRALLATGFPPDRRERAAFYLAFVRVVLERGQCVRRAGSAALDLCYVACGRLDGFWESKLHPWDIAAGRVIVEEAGGRVTDFRGGPHDISGHETAASNGRVHPELLAALAAARELAEAERATGD
jgi:myo-inositol-1(or 4)-monophosphatase